MSYTALYRKYRPKTFEEVVGQEHITKTLKNQIISGRVGHAYLLNGGRGTGKTSSAKILARAINCLNPQNGNPCNECEICKAALNGSLTDIVEMDAASNNSVEDIRSIRDEVNFLPTVAKYRVYIIDEVHMLSIGAFNALLKTLEEPPEHVKFILATTEPQKLPATILSRCQRFDFKKISSEFIKARLNYICQEDKIKIEEEAINTISVLAEGAMRDALSILDQVVAYSESKITVKDVHEINGTIPQDELKHFIKYIALKKYNEIFNMIDEYDNNGKNFVKLSEEIINFYRNILLVMNATEYSKENISNVEIYKEFEKIIEESTIINNINEFNRIIFEMKKSNNPRLIFETAIIKLLGQNKKIKPVDISKLPEEKQPVKKVSEPNIKQNDNIDKEIIEKIKKIRINNTLCNFNKKQLLEMLSEIENIRIMLMQPEYSEIVSLILDGKLKAVGNSNLIFVFENKKLSNMFNENILKIDKLFKETFNKNYSTISVDINEWNIIKEEFNGKKKKYSYIEEPLITTKEENKNKIDSEFSDIIEYD